MFSLYIFFIKVRASNRFFTLRTGLHVPYMMYEKPVLCRPKKPFSVIHCPSLSVRSQNHMTVLLRGLMQMFRLEDSVTVSVRSRLLSTLTHCYSHVMTQPVILNLNLAFADSISFWTN